MRCPPLSGSALLAKVEAFFALCLARMQPVPDHRAEKTEDTSDRTRDCDKCNRSDRIERFSEVNWLDHVGPENEIENRLGQTNENKKRSKDMPAADQHGDHQANFIGIGHCFWL